MRYLREEGTGFLSICNQAQTTSIHMHVNILMHTLIHKHTEKTKNHAQREVVEYVNLYLLIGSIS